jgi:hypothetical protein
MMYVLIFYEHQIVRFEFNNSSSYSQISSFAIGWQ